MLRRVLAGVDGRDGGRAALMLAGRLARAAHGSLIAAHVLPAEAVWPPRAVAGGEPVAEAHRLLDAETRAAAVDARCRVVHAGSPASGLRRLGRHAGAELTVVGASVRGPIDRVVAGDTARALVRRARSPVAVVPTAPQFSPAGRPAVGVGVDGGAPSHRALAWARELAWLIDADLRVVCAAEPAPAFGISGARQQAAERTLDDALARLPASATGEVWTAPAREALRALGAEVDLLVVGARGLGPVRRTLLGSTADHLLQDPDCPVVVVPAAGRTAAAPTVAQREGASWTALG